MPRTTHRATHQRVDLYLPQDQLARVEAWRLSQPGEPSRTKALQHLINRGLEAVTSDRTYAPVTRKRRPATK